MASKFKSFSAKDKCFSDTMCCSKDSYLTRQFSQYPEFFIVSFFGGCVVAFRLGCNVVWVEVVVFFDAVIDSVVIILTSLLNFRFVDADFTSFFGRSSALLLVSVCVELSLIIVCERISSFCNTFALDLCLVSLAVSDVVVVVVVVAAVA